MTCNDYAITDFVSDSDSPQSKNRQAVTSWLKVCPYRAHHADSHRTTGKKNDEIREVSETPCVLEQELLIRNY